MTELQRLETIIDGITGEEAKSMLEYKVNSALVITRQAIAIETAKAAALAPTVMSVAKTLWMSRGGLERLFDEGEAWKDGHAFEQRQQCIADAKAVLAMSLIPEQISVWVVYGDDHDHDMMSQWLVGAYASEVEANEASEVDRARYVARGGDKNSANYSIEETTLRIGDGTTRTENELRGPLLNAVAVLEVLSTTDKITEVEHGRSLLTEAATVAERGRAALNGDTE